MISSAKQNQMIEKIDNHLRKVARQLVKFDSLDETLHYLIESFWNQFDCDYVSIILKTKDVLNIKVSKGTAQNFEGKFPLDRSACSGRFLSEPTCCYDSIEEEQYCDFLRNLEEEGFSTWFTVPIKESGSNSLGVCVIGFRQVVPLILKGREMFEEFGKDIATAIEIALSKEIEKKKMIGMEWLKENVYLGSSLEQLVGNITERAAKGTHAESAYVYLYDEVQNCFIYQAPSFGPMISHTKIKIEDNYNLFHYFPFLDKEGGREITIPLIVNYKTIGVLHVINKRKGTFTEEDLELLQFLSSHVSVLIENARLYKNEKEDRSRLERLMVHHQELVKQTLVGEGFEEITQSLSQMIGRTVVLFDRFLRPVSHSIVNMNQEEWETLLNQLYDKKWDLLNSYSHEQWLRYEGQSEFGIWKVIGGGDLLGYLGMKINKREIDMFLRMTLNQALNVYAIQLIKQKLVMDVKEQVKDSFINQLFVEKMEDKDRLIEYATLINLNIFEPNKIGVFSIVFNEYVYRERDLLDIETKKTWLWEQIRENLKDQGMILTRRDGLYILIVPEKKEKEVSNYWESVYHQLKNIVSKEIEAFDIYLGIGQTAKSIDDYYICYKQAIQTLKIVTNLYPDKGFLSFDSLGSYSVLYNLQETFAAKLFLKNYLDPLLNYRNGKGKDLFETLRVYLNMNGNLKDTAEHLFIHRSTLKYRLEKIRELLQRNIDDAEERFNLMLAYKLYDLFELKE